MADDEKNEGGSGIPSGDAVRRAREQVAELTGRRVDGVLGVERGDEGWELTLQVVELARIPDSTDVLGSYRVTLDADGEVTGWRRIRRYYRSQVDEG